MPFLPKKTPEGTTPASTRGLEASNHLVWSHPVTLHSLVVKHTTWTRNWTTFYIFDTFHQFPKTQFAQKSSISMIWSWRSVLPSQNRDAHLFHVEKRHWFTWFWMILIISWFWAQGPWGPWDPPCFWDFLKTCFMVWDLSRSVPGVFRSPGNPLINLFHFLFNSKCHFRKCHFLLNCLL